MNLPIKKVDLFSCIAGEPWAILPEKLSALWKQLESCSDNIVDLATLRGDVSASTGATVIQKGAAVIKIHGVIEKKSSFMMWLFGGASTEDIALEIEAAVANPDVDSIILDIDSPGGSVAGTKELADTIYNLRGEKPIKAFINGLGASAAYWIASAADEIVTYDTAQVGSIGVVTYHYDVSKMYEAAGVNKTYIYAGKYKVAGNETKALSKEDASYMQSRIDSLYSLFVNDVARNRGMDVKDVTKTEAKVFIGQEAMAAGLVDRIGTFRSVLEDSVGKLDASAAMAYNAATATLTVPLATNTDNKITITNKEDVPMDLKTLKEKHPELVEAIKGEVVSASTEELLADQGSIDTLKEQAETMKGQVEALSTENKALTKKFTILEEQTASALAGGIVTSALSDSDIPEKLHAKVETTMPAFGKFVAEGDKFEAGSESVTKFTEAVQVEVKSWEDNLPVSVGLGLGAPDPKGDVSSSEAEDVALGQDLARELTGSIRSDQKS